MQNREDTQEVSLHNRPILIRDETSPSTSWLDTPQRNLSVDSHVHRQMNAREADVSMHHRERQSRGNSSWTDVPQRNYGVETFVVQG